MHVKIIYLSSSVEYGFLCALKFSRIMLIHCIKEITPLCCAKSLELRRRNLGGGPVGYTYLWSIYTCLTAVRLV